MNYHLRITLEIHKVRHQMNSYCMVWLQFFDLARIELEPLKEVT